MGENLINGLVAVAVAVVGVAIVATLVSKNSQTPDVLSAAGSSLATAIKAATGPVNSSNSAYGIA
jgi:hypothetical protein